MTLINLVLFGLATFRIAHVFVWERGPGDLFRKLRKIFGATNWNPEESVGFMAGVFSCVWCMSMWVGFFFTALVLFNLEVAVMVAFPFALSAIAITIRECVDNLGKEQYEIPLERLSIRSR